MLFLNLTIVFALLYLQEDKYIENLTNEIINNPNNEQKKKHDIIQAINNSCPASRSTAI